MTAASLAYPFDWLSRFRFLSRRPEEDDGMGRQLRRIHVGAFTIVAIFALWSTVAVMSGAVIAVGHVVVDTEVKTVQHPTGGVVGEILVRNGHRVNAGDLLLKLDETVALAGLEIVRKHLVQLEARHARLHAERSGRTDVDRPPTLAGNDSEADLSVALVEEVTFFEARRSARDGQKAQLEERIVQLGDEIDGLSAQLTAIDGQQAFVLGELDGVRKLYEKKLVQLNRLSMLEQQKVELDGTRGSLVASIAQSKGKIAEARLAILQLDADMREDVSAELGDVQAKIAEAAERLRAARDQLMRVEIRAPTAGIVNELKVHTVGGVIAPGEAILRIVPEDQDLVVEARVAPESIDRISIDQPAIARFSAFDRSTTPELVGRVTYVSADLAEDPHTGVTYYSVRVALDTGELARFGERRVVPGMPVEVHLSTGERTVMSYLLKPLTDQVGRAMRER